MEKFLTKRLEATQQILVKGLSVIQPVFYHLKQVKNEAGELKIIIGPVEDSAAECKQRL